jgi:hypothetical protein
MILNINNQKLTLNSICTNNAYLFHEHYTKYSKTKFGELRNPELEIMDTKRIKNSCYALFRNRYFDKENNEDNYYISIHDVSRNRLIDNISYKFKNRAIMKENLPIYLHEWDSFATEYKNIFNRNFNFEEYL